MSQPTRPDPFCVAERFRPDARRNIRREVSIANDSIDLYSPDHRIQPAVWDEAVPELRFLKEAFRRAKVIHHRLVAYDRQYWAVGIGLHSLTTDETIGEGGKTRHPAVVLAGKLLLQLVALSRVELPQQGGSFALPTLEACEAVRQSIRAELGITPAAVEEAKEKFGPFRAPFTPGIDSTGVTESILDGRLLMGNPEQSQVFYAGEPIFE